MMLRVLVGSTVHGTAIEGMDDRDEMGICVEPPQSVIGLNEFKHYSFRTAEQRQPTKDGNSPPSLPGDLDLTVYSLRRYVALAAAGNPSMLLPLFVPEDAVLYANEFGRELRAYRHMFISRKLGLRFKHYLHNQRRGMLGERNTPSRAELREQHSFDSKYAAHAIRLGIQGVELLTTGELTLPIESKMLAELRALRQGQRSLEWALAQTERYEQQIDAGLESTRLPAEPDWMEINRWLVDVHRRHWGFGE
jgi:predicted nucleotidyltransferase